MPRPRRADPSGTHACGPAPGTATTGSSDATSPGAIDLHRPGIPADISSYPVLASGPRIAEPSDAGGRHPPRETVEIHHLPTAVARKP
jgi:hypothetical protein